MTDEVTPNENKEVALKVEIINKDKPIEKKHPTSSDTIDLYSEMDNTDEEIEAYMEDINAQ